MKRTKIMLLLLK